MGGLIQPISPQMRSHPILLLVWGWAPNIWKVKWTCNSERNEWWEFWFFRPCPTLDWAGYVTACWDSVAGKHQKETDNVNGEVLFRFLFAFPAIEIYGFLGRRKHTGHVSMQYVQKQKGVQQSLEKLPSGWGPINSLVNASHAFFLTFLGQAKQPPPFFFFLSIKGFSHCARSNHL